MSEDKLVSANKAFRKGLWQVRVWPLVVMIIAFGGLTYAALELALPVMWAIASFLLVVLLCAIWSLRRIGVWKSWMAANTVNPKTALEMAKASFLKQPWKENLAIWGKVKKETYRQNFDDRMAAVKESYLKDAEKRYAEKKPVIIHYRFAGLLWMLLFEVIVLTGVLLLFMYQPDVTLKTIAGVLFFIVLRWVVLYNQNDLE